MVRNTFVILACLMALTIVASKKAVFPTRVDHVDKQCQTDRHRYEASCANQQRSNGELVNCAKIYCMGTTRSSGGLYRAMSIGKADDGTHCAENKVCIGGKCTALLAGQSMPREEGISFLTANCYYPNSGRKSSRH